MTKSKPIAIKSVVTYTCKYGFMVVGDATRTCGEDKQWSGLEPKVKEVLLSHTGAPLALVQRLPSIPSISRRGFSSDTKLLGEIFNMWSEILSAHTALGGGLVDSKDQNFLLKYLYSSFLDFSNQTLAIS